MLYVLLLGHFIGDFLLQNNRLVEYKNKRFSGVLLHSAIVLAVYLILIWGFIDGYETASLFEVFILSIFLTFSHLVIDILKYILIKTKFGKSRDMCIFLLDQLFHIISILVIYDSYYGLEKNQILTLESQIIVI